MFTASIGRVRSAGLAALFRSTYVLLAFAWQVTWAGSISSGSISSDSLEAAVDRLHQLLPDRATEYDTVAPEELIRAVTEVDLTSAEVGGAMPSGVQSILARI